MTLDDLRALATSTRDGQPCWGGDYAFAPTLAEAEFLYALVRMMRPTNVLELAPASVPHNDPCPSSTVSMNAASSSCRSA